MYLGICVVTMSARLAEMSELELGKNFLPA